ncbi:MAG: response regulator [Ruminococcaceae bacterium]|jgi:CheY-like chemotaxis protein|nr:response regulator [Oscillospiraceae bacterium]
MEAAGRKVMFITTRETLITNGILRKIAAEGKEPYYVYNKDQLAAQSLENHCAVVYHLGDDVKELGELHAKLDELCARSGKKVICIGTQEQYHVFLEDFAQVRVAAFFERPLNMDRFLKCVIEGQDTANQRKRILIVDDDASYRQLVREWLKDKYDISMANGGTQAITVLSAKTCDLVLLDYEMPIVPGPQVMEMIRSMPQTENIPIVFLTGKDDEMSIRRVLELHPAGYLLKTVSEADLLKKVEDVLAAT